jgi:hypothetical protein
VKIQAFRLEITDPKTGRETVSKKAENQKFKPSP